MKHYQQFIDTLVTLKSYYQNQVEEYERKANEAKEQLNHVDALLFDQLQHQYKQQLLDSLQTQATSQTEAQALGAVTRNISPPDLPEIDSNSHLTKSPASSEQKLSRFEAISQTGAVALESAPQNTSPLLSPEVEIDSGILEPAQQQIHSNLKKATPALTTDSSQDEQPSAANAENEFLGSPVVQSAISLPIEQAIEADTTNELNESQDLKSATNETNNLPPTPPIEAASPVATAPDRSRTRHVAPLKTPLLPTYQHLSKSEAVENFLQSNEGKTFHIDDITRGLHGDLGVEAIRAEKSRMYDTLRKGISKGLWAAVPNAPNYYTIDLNSLKSTAQQQELLLESALSPDPTRRSKYSDLLLPRYGHLSFSEAIEIVVQENAGEILTPERVTRDLFGNISETTLTKAQAQVTKWLRDGAKLGLWQRVPGQLAQYILDLK